VRHFALSTSLAITRYTSLPCPRCNINCCFCNLDALFTVYFVSCMSFIILHIDCILVCIVYYTLFFLYHFVMNKVAQCGCSHYTVRKLDFSSVEFMCRERGFSCRGRSPTPSPCHVVMSWPIVLNRITDGPADA